MKEAINKKKTMPSSSYYTSKKDQSANTPSKLLQQIKTMFVPEGEELFDPCPPLWNSTWLWDALNPNCQWRKYNFINPPFVKAKEFLQRAIEQDDSCVSIILLPCRFHTKYIHDILPHLKRIVILDKNVKFVGYKRSMPTNICLLIFGPNDLLKELPGMKTPVYKCTFVNLGSVMLDKAKELSDLKSRHVLMNNLSQPLSDILSKFKKKDKISVLMPLRLENLIVRQRILQNPNAEMFFIRPLLKFPEDASSPQRFKRLVQGSMMVMFNSGVGDIKIENQITFIQKTYAIMTPNNHHDEKDTFLTLPAQETK